MDLAVLLEGDACKKAKSHAEDLLAKLTNESQIRRLKGHLALHNHCFTMWPDKIMNVEWMVVAEAATALSDANVTFPIPTRMDILRKHASSDWEIVMHTDQTLEVRKQVGQRVALQFAPWTPDGVPNTFSFENPTLAQAQLSDQSLAETLLYELWNEKICKWIGCGEESDLTISLFADSLVT